MTDQIETLRLLERFIDFDASGGHPMYVTANGIPQDMPASLRKYALRLRAALAAPSLDVERLARAIGVIAIEDRDRVIAGDWSADTYERHAERIAKAYAEERP